MLYMSSANKIVRIHGPYVAEKEIEKITNILRQKQNLIILMKLLSTKRLKIQIMLLMMTLTSFIIKH